MQHDEIMRLRVSQSPDISDSYRLPFHQGSDADIVS